MNRTALSGTTMNSTPTNRTAHGFRVVMAALGLAMAGCGGGSDGGSAAIEPSPPAAQPAPPSNPPPTGRSTLVVTVTDPLGTPMSGVLVRVHSPAPSEATVSGVTGAGGRAEITGVVNDSVTVTAETSEVYGQATAYAPTGSGTRQQQVVAWPKVAATAGIAGAFVPPGGVQDDGRTLEFTLQVLHVPAFSTDRWDLGPDPIRVIACVPDPANDTPRIQSDCVSGVEGFDAAYDVIDGGRALALQTVPTQGGYEAIHRPTFSSTLLLDQSGVIGLSDPGDDRLFAAKHFLTWGNEEHVVGLAGFAAGDDASGQSALLPQQPVTIFPIENPTLTTAGRDLFPSVSSLASLEGGGAPLYAALDRLLDFAAARPGEVSTIIVVTDGRDTTCDPGADCRERREAVLQKSRANKVTISTVGLASGSREVDREALGALSLAGYGGDRAAFWASDPRQLPAILSTALTHQLRNGVDQLGATFRIHATTAGTFASGRTILGWIRVEDCPWDCYYTDIPFAVEIP